MTNLNFAELDNCFRTNDFPTIENDNKGIRFLKLRSMSRKATMEEFFDLHDINYDDLNSRQYFQTTFDSNQITNAHINEFINSKYQEERQKRIDNQEYLVDQLSRLQNFDWGGSFGNSLEKNIVNNYVKKIQSYDQINCTSSNDSELFQSKNKRVLVLI